MSFELSGLYCKYKSEREKKKGAYADVTFFKIKQKKHAKGKAEMDIKEKHRDMLACNLFEAIFFFLQRIYLSAREHLFHFFFFLQPSRWKRKR